MPDQRFQLICADLATAEVKPESLDWIITDPPYERKSLDGGIIAKLRDFSHKNLKPGGSLLCMIGQSWLPEIYRDLGGIQTFQYHWTLAYT